MDGRLIDDVEIAGSSTGFRARKGKHEEVIPGLKYVVGLANRRNAAAVLEALLNASDIHVPPRNLRPCPIFHSESGER